MLAGQRLSLGQVHRLGRLAKRKAPKPSEGGGQQDSYLEPVRHAAIKPAWPRAGQAT